MLHAVLDTAILVSALMRPQGPSGEVMSAVMRGGLVPVFDAGILAEYDDVLTLPRLQLDLARVELVLTTIRAIGLAVPGDATPPTPLGLPDPSDWPFIVCALAIGCPVITGSARHFPPEVGVPVITAREWVEVDFGRG